MITYIPTSGAETAQALSDSLWGLTRPPQVRDPEDTQQLFGTTTMKDGSVWLACDTEFSIPVHAQAELDGIADILQPWIDSGALPADTNTQLAAFIEASKGGTLVVYDAFPQLFKDQSKTREELISLNLFPTIS
jgi:hypothetical protein